MIEALQVQSPITNVTTPNTSGNGTIEDGTIVAYGASSNGYLSGWNKAHTITSGNNVNASNQSAKTTASASVKFSEDKNSVNTGSTAALQNGKIKLVSLGSVSNTAKSSTVHSRLILHWRKHGLAVESPISLPTPSTHSNLPARHTFMGRHQILLPQAITV